ncbi:MAG TPA: hypothetical protein VJ917_11935 [Saprospiraceae bacterium]|nr:hypothetical protein [Saprospiraceae bacterium]
MLQNKLFHYIQQFDRKEMTRFREFALSPYHFKHEDTRKLIALLDKYYPNFNERNCDRKKLFQKLFPGQKHDQKQLALLFTYATRLLEKFLITEELEESVAENKILLLRKLRKLEQEKTYRKLYRKFKTKLDKKNFRDTHHYRFQFLLSDEANLYPDFDRGSKKKPIIQIKQNSLDKYFMAEKLHDVCEMHVRSLLLNTTYDPGLIQGVEDYLKHRIDDFLEVPAVYMYYHLYLLIVKDDEEKYHLLVEALPKNESAFRKKELQDFYNFLRNYCLLKTNQGHQKYLEEVFRLYKQQLETGLMLDNEGILAEWHYKNIITAGINLGDMDWVEQFIHDYKDKLHPDLRENAYSYNLANFYYADEAYDKAQDLLLDVEYTDVRYSLNAKMLLLRIYYEKDEFMALQSLLESSRLYVQRNKLISEEVKLRYYNFIKFARRVYNVQNHVGYSADEKVARIINRIDEELKKTQNIFFRSWLDEKIREVKSGIGLESYVEQS